MMNDDESDQQQVGVSRETVMAHFMVLTSFLHGQKTHEEIRHHKRVIWLWFEMNDIFYYSLRLKIFLVRLSNGVKFLTGFR
jgi:hypothetical protein